MQYWDTHRLALSNDDKSLGKASVSPLVDQPALERLNRWALDAIALAIAHRNDVAVFVLNPDGVVLWASDSARLITGWDPGDFIGMTVGDRLTSHRTNPRVLAAIGEHCRMGLPIVRRYVGRQRSGHEFWVQAEIVPHRDDLGNLISLVKCIRRIHPQADHEQRSQEVVSQKVADLHHDIGNPLVVAAGLLDELIDGPLDLPQRHLALKAREALELLRRGLSHEEFDACTQAEWTPGQTESSQEDALSERRQVLEQQQGVVLDLRGKVALVVDDNAMSRLVCKRLLERLGATVMEAEDGLAAIELMVAAQEAEKKSRTHQGLAHRNFLDLILMDINMPRMDGMTLARRLFTHDQWSGIPVVAVSSALDESNRLLLRRSGVHHFIRKPFDRHEFMAILAGVHGLVEQEHSSLYSARNPALKSGEG